MFFWLRWSSNIIYRQACRHVEETLQMDLRWLLIHIYICECSLFSCKLDHSDVRKLSHSCYLQIEFFYILPLIATYIHNCITKFFHAWKYMTVLTFSIILVKLLYTIGYEILVLSVANIWDIHIYIHLILGGGFPGSVHWVMMPV